MAVKRRVIWMDDDEWFLIREMAADSDQSVSALIRSMWNEGGDLEASPTG